MTKMDDSKSKVDIDAIIAELKKTNVKFNAEFVNKFIDVIYDQRICNGGRCRVAFD